MLPARRLDLSSPKPITTSRNRVMAALENCSRAMKWRSYCSITALYATRCNGSSSMRQTPTVAATFANSTCLAPNQGYRHPVASVSLMLPALRLKDITVLLLRRQSMEQSDSTETLTPVIISHLESWPILLTPVKISSFFKIPFLLSFFSRTLV